MFVCLNIWGWLVCSSYVPVCLCTYRVVWRTVLDIGSPFLLLRDKVFVVWHTANAKLAGLWVPRDFDFALRWQGMPPCPAFVGVLGTQVLLPALGECSAHWVTLPGLCVYFSKGKWCSLSVGLLQKSRTWKFPVFLILNFKLCKTLRTLSELALLSCFLLFIHHFFAHLFTSFSPSFFHSESGFHHIGHAGFELATLLPFPAFC